MFKSKLIWLINRIKVLIEATYHNNGKFIWAIGGWSDLTKTILPSQVDSFVQKCVELLAAVGDGIDFDWEHLSIPDGWGTSSDAAILE